MAPTARYTSDGSNAVCAGVSKKASTRRGSERFDRRNDKANANAEQNATAWRARLAAFMIREATRVEASAAKPLARNAPPWEPSDVSPGRGASAPWKRRAVSEAVALNVAVAAIDLESMVVVVVVISFKVGGRWRFEIPTHLMEKCDSPQIMCLQEKGER